MECDWLQLLYLSRFETEGGTSRKTLCHGHILVSSSHSSRQSHTGLAASIVAWLSVLCKEGFKCCFENSTLVTSCSTIASSSAPHVDPFIDAFCYISRLMTHIQPWYSDWNMCISIAALLSILYQNIHKYHWYVLFIYGIMLHQFWEWALQLSSPWFRFAWECS